MTTEYHANRSDLAKVEQNKTSKDCKGCVKGPTVADAANAAQAKANQHDPACGYYAADNQVTTGRVRGEHEVRVHKGVIHDDVTLHVEDYGGAGRPVVLIHGWPLSGRAWSNQIDALQKAGFRTITYDRRGFGESSKPTRGFDYDTLAADLHKLIETLDLHRVTLVGFSMGGGEVARYMSKHQTCHNKKNLADDKHRIRSVVFASAVPPYLAYDEKKNPDGPLRDDAAKAMAKSLDANELQFYDQFVDDFFTTSTDGRLAVTPEQRAAALALTAQADKKAALACMDAFATTDFRDDLAKLHVPTLVIHGDADRTVPLAGSGARTHAAVAGSELHIVRGGPHGINVSHADEFNRVLIDFLNRHN